MTSLIPSHGESGDITKHLPYTMIVQGFPIGDHGYRSGRINDDYVYNSYPQANAIQSPYRISFSTTSSGGGAAEMEPLSEGEISPRIMVQDEMTGLIYWANGGNAFLNSNMHYDIRNFAGPQYTLAFPVAHIAHGEIRSCDVIACSFEGATFGSRELGSARLTAAVARNIAYRPQSVTIPERDLIRFDLDSLEMVDEDNFTSAQTAVPEIDRNQSDEIPKLADSQVVQQNEGPFSTYAVHNRADQANDYEVTIVPTLDQDDEAFVAHTLNGVTYWVPVREVKYSVSASAHTNSDLKLPDLMSRKLMGLPPVEEPLRRHVYRPLEHDFAFKVVKKDGSTEHYLVDVNLNAQGGRREATTYVWELREKGVVG